MTFWEADFSHPFWLSPALNICTRVPKLVKNLQSLFPYLTFYSLFLVTPRKTTPHPQGIIIYNATLQLSSSEQECCGNSHSYDKGPGKLIARLTDITLRGGSRGVQGVHPLSPKMKSSSHSLLKFFYLTGQWRHFLGVHPLLRKILGLPDTKMMHPSKEPNAGNTVGHKN